MEDFEADPGIWVVGSFVGISIGVALLASTPAVRWLFGGVVIGVATISILVVRNTHSEAQPDPPASSNRGL